MIFVHFLKIVLHFLYRKTAVHFPFAKQFSRQRQKKVSKNNTAAMLFRHKKSPNFGQL
jgi:hypothetical protein